VGVLPQGLPEMRVVINDLQLLALVTWLS
jgi:hypothetical protein